MRVRMDEYGKICRELAQEQGCIFVDFQEMFDRFFAIRHPSSVNADRVHPDMAASTLMAHKFLRHCAFEFSK